MAGYLPLLLVIFSVALLAIVIGWPWLRDSQTRDRAVLSVVVGVLLSLALYLAVGSPFEAAQITAQRDHAAQLADRAEELQRELAADAAPDEVENARKWLELGAIRMELGQAAGAEDALKHAVVASGGHPQVIMAYGKAQMAAAGGEMTEGAKQAFEIASRLLPQDPEPLLLLAMGHMQAGEPEQGRVLLQKALPLLPQGSPMRGFIEQRMREADAKRAAEGKAE